MTLRENQIKPVEIGINFFNEKNPKPSIIVAPTAFGKSIVIAKIAESIKDNVLILQPTKELLDQNYNKYIALGGKAQIYSASFGSKKIGSVTYATIGSIKNIGSKFKNLGFTKMIIDEAHLYPRNADSMLGKFLEESCIVHVLGLTATPLKLQSNIDITGNVFSKLVMLTSRSKKGNFFKEIIYVSQIEEMVNLAYWSKLIYLDNEIDNSKLRFNSTKADYTEESLEIVYKSNDIDEKILQTIKDIPERKSIIVFVPSVANAIAISNRLNGSAAIYGNMDKKDRERAIRRFKQGFIRVIFNVNVLSVGFDHPGIDTIICARPTASLAWFYQALGRGTRIEESKKDCLIIDFSGNVKKFGKIENLYYKKENIWKLYGEGEKLLTGCPLHSIGEIFEGKKPEKENNPKDDKVFVGFGKYRDIEVKDTPEHWRKWIMEEFTKNNGWNKWNSHVKKEIENLNKQLVNI